MTIPTFVCTLCNKILPNYKKIMKNKNWIELENWWEKSNDNLKKEKTEQLN